MTNVKAELFHVEHMADKIIENHLERIPRKRGPMVRRGKNPKKYPKASVLNNAIARKQFKQNGGKS